MFELYLWTTPNGYKPLILLEELGVDYQLKWVNLANKEQKNPEFLKLNPNGKIPVLVDKRSAKPITVFESGAILIYLAEQSGEFLPHNEPERSQVISWLMWQMSGVGPMFGQYVHFKHLDNKIPYALDRYHTEAKRLLDVLEQQLSKHAYVAGEYSIADMALYPWLRNLSKLDFNSKDYPQISKWVDAISSRKAVQKAYELKP